jgi:hypothetical protein
MTPKEKAKELVDKMLESLYDNGSLSFKRILYDKAKQCALIAVDEILYVLNEIDSTEQWNASWFYNEVKQEIDKL